MKSYTDLEQSKMLAEILPLESADMFFADLLVNRKHKYLVNLLETYSCKTFKDTEAHKSKRLSFIPCWSLAALLSVLPKYIGSSVLRMDMGENDFSLWFDDLSNIVDGNLPDITKDNPIDACYEMVVKLNELKLLYYVGESRL